MIRRSEVENFIQRTCPEEPLTLEKATTWLATMTPKGSCYSRFTSQDVFELWKEAQRDNRSKPNEYHYKRGKR